MNGEEEVERYLLERGGKDGVDVCVYWEELVSVFFSFIYFACLLFKISISILY